MKEKELIEIENICDLIKQTPKYKLRKNNKIDFAYQYWNTTDKDIIDLYNYLAKSKPENAAYLARTISDFVDNQGITQIRRFYSWFFNQKPDDIIKSTTPIKTNGNWLSLYNIEKEFSSKSTHSNPIIYSYLTDNNNVVTIDKDKANSILGILVENDIPTAKIIVTSSFPYYAKDDMNTYIKSLKK